MLLDTYAWVEFFLGSEKGEKVKGALQREFCYTSIITIAELTKWCLKNNLDVPKHISAVKKASAVLDLNEAICVLAGKTCFEARKVTKDFGLIDALIAATAQIYGLKILTGDPHFANFGNAELL